jgi:superfamily II DNA or RNA helicase
MAISLRTYQSEALAAARADWSSGAERIIVSMPTGSGKTILFLFLIHGAHENGHRCIVLVNSDVLVHQTVQKLGRVGIAAGVIKAKYNEWSRPVVVASVQTLSRKERLQYVPPGRFGLCIVDECHYANSASYQRTLRHLRAKYVLGVTATAFRGDNQSLADAGWERVSYAYSLEDAVRDGYLVSPNIRRVDTGIALIKSAKSTSYGERDFSSKSLSKCVNTDERNEQIVGAYRDQIPGSKCIAFCVDVEHAWALANAFRKRGVKAQMIYGMTPKPQRRELLEAHQQGAFDVLTNCNVLTHGYDDPSLQGIIMARPTLSKVLYMQSVGRGLRPHEGKECCELLDVVDVSRTHEIAVNAEIMGLQREMGQT